MPFHKTCFEEGEYLGRKEITDCLFSQPHSFEPSENKNIKAIKLAAVTVFIITTIKYAPQLLKKSKIHWTESGIRVNQNRYKKVRIYLVKLKNF